MRAMTPYRLDVRRFDKMLAADLFGDRKVELLNGLLIMMTTGPAHDFVVTALADTLRGRLDKTEWSVREEKPVVLSPRWKTLPDVAVVRGPGIDYAKRTPGAVDIALLVEVSDTTYPKDSGFKRRWYARFGIPAYWIVHINRRMVEVYTLDDTGLGLTATYAEQHEIPLSLDGRNFGTMPATGLFP
jgi:Uma2 family endonuclease